MQTNFLLGTLNITPSARLILKRLPLDLVARHAINEHGLITRSERKSNEMSMRVIGPIISRYRAEPLNPNSPWVIIETEQGWGSTLIRVE